LSPGAEVEITNFGYGSFRCNTYLTGRAETDPPSNLILDPDLDISMRVKALILTRISLTQVSQMESGLTHLVVPRFKQRLTLVCPPLHSLYEILDVTKACDAVVFLLCPHTGLSGQGELVLSSVLAQSLPTEPLLLLGNTDEIPAKKLADVKRLLLRQRCGTVLYFTVPVPVPTFEKLWFRFLLLKSYGSGSGSSSISGTYKANFFKKIMGNFVVVLLSTGKLFYKEKV
jgi:hypothetical protein